MIVWLRRIRLGPQSALIILAGGMLAYLTIIPLVMLIYGSLKSGPAGVAGALTFENYLKLFANWRLAPALLNSLIFSTGSSLLAFAGGLYLAWTTERTNAPWRSGIYVCVLVPMIVPGILTTVGCVSSTDADSTRNARIATTKEATVNGPNIFKMFIAARSSMADSIRYARRSTIAESAMHRLRLSFYHKLPVM